MSDFEQCSNPLQPDLHVNYDFMRTGNVVECLSGLELDLISLFLNRSCQLTTIMLRYGHYWLPRDEMRLILRNKILTLPNVTLSQSFLDNCDK